MAPQLVESYHKMIAGNSKVEMIHFSYDRSDADALRWAQKGRFPWPTVLGDKHDATGLEAFANNDVPEYILIRKDGKVIANGKEECFAAFAMLGGG